MRFAHKVCMERCSICEHRRKSEEGQEAVTRDTDKSKRKLDGSYMCEEKFEPRRVADDSKSETRYVDKQNVRDPDRGRERSGVTRRNSSHVGSHYVEVERGNMESNGGLLSSKNDTAFRSQRRFIPRCTKIGNVDKISVRPRVAYDVHSNERKHNSSEIILKGAASAGSSRTSSTDATSNTVSANETLQKRHAITGHRNLDLLEGCSALDGSRRATGRPISEHCRAGNRDLLGKKHKDNTSQSIPPIHARHNIRTGDRANSELLETPSEKPKTVQDHSSRDGPRNKKGARKRVWHPLYKTGGCNVSTSGSRQRPPQLVGGANPHKASELRESSPIQCSAVDDSKSTGHAPSVSAIARTLSPVEMQECYKEVPYLKRHTLVCARRSSKLAKPKDFHIPLHVKPGVPTIDMNKIRSWMSTATASRFEQVWKELLRMPSCPETSPRMKGSLSHTDHELLLKHGIISAVSEKEENKRPSMQFLVPFTVIETDDEGKQRRRFISWTRSDNARLSEYVPQVPLLHPSKYLHRVKAQSGLKRDLVCGFYQISIPQECRQKFRFYSDTGVLYEMRVLPMGHRCAPELMHTVTATIAGMKGYCKSTFSQGALDIYVDGVRFAGTDQQACQYKKWVDDRAQETGARFKDSGLLPMKEYVFNGVRYDHRVHKVNLGPKVVAKLEKDQFTRTTFLELEATVGRLLYCSSVVGIIIPKYYFALKICQRRINLLNRMPEMAEEVVDLPNKIRDMLRQWRNELVRNIPVEPLPHPEIAPREHNLYTDASAKGWGGILYLDSGEVIIVGGQWKSSWQYEVNRAEATAVRLSLQKLERHFTRGTCLQLWVDNTSCQAALNRKISKSGGISNQLGKVLQWAKDRGVCIKADYVSTKDNPADPVSRNFAR